MTLAPSADFRFSTVEGMIGPKRLSVTQAYEDTLWIRSNVDPLESQIQQSVHSIREAQHRLQVCHGNLDKPTNQVARRKDGTRVWLEPYGPGCGQADCSHYDYDSRRMLHSCSKCKMILLQREAEIDTFCITPDIVQERRKQFIQPPTSQ
jgi:hypothetical protein